MAYSFRDVIVDGKIFSPAVGDEINLSLWGDNKLPYVQSVEFNFDMAGESAFSVSLAPTYQEALRLINETPWLRMGNTLGMRWGYNDGIAGHISEWIYGWMQPPDVSFGDEINITLRATTYVSHMMNRTKRKVSHTKPNEDRTFKEIATEMAARYGMPAPNFDDVTNVNSSHGMLEPRVDIVQSGETDLQFLRNEAKKYGVDLLIENQYMKFVDSDKGIKEINSTGPGMIQAEFHMYGKMRPSENIFPMTGFTPTNMGPLFYAKTGTFKTIFQGPDDDPAQEPTVLESKPAGEKTGENAFSGKDMPAVPGVEGAQDKYTKLKSSVDLGNDDMASSFRVITESGKNYKERLQKGLAAYQIGQSDDYGIELEFDSIAIPKLKVHHMVRLRGVGDYFSVDAKLKNIRVSIDNSGASMTGTTMTKGLPEGLEAFVEQAEKSDPATSNPDPNSEDKEPEEV